MNLKTMNLLVQMRKTGFGLGFILGGLFMGAVMLWTGQAHAHDFKQGDLVMFEAMGGGFTWGASLVRF